ncbi:WD40-repeat-containing domain protein [Scheffersomyces xylosifermentans]|uniref:WD40-repeat-containing domain protein n=1 Tax=Scheffersomyces xylosifermentans TaxID=1304137 RepID=UPI00315C7096
MDRQSLLEQKKKRLQELKQRRLAGASSDESVDQLLEQIQQRSISSSQYKRGIEIGIQVDLESLRPGNSAGTNTAFTNSVNFQPVPTKPEKECPTYDKAVQTSDISDVLPEKEEDVGSLAKDAANTSTEPSQKNSTTTEVQLATRFDHRLLNESLKESIKLLNKIKNVETVDLSKYSNQLNGEQKDSINGKDKGESPFQLVAESKKIQNRFVTSIDYSTHFPQLVVVAYYSTSKAKEGGLRDTTSSDPSGLSIVYSINKGTLFPEYILHSTLPVSVIQFDRNDSKRVIGGLLDGKIIIWDLKTHNSTSVPILPQLSTPTFSATANKFDTSSGLKFKHHIHPIVSIIQVILAGNNSIVSVSVDGIVNIWSSSFLASPKSDSIQLHIPKNVSDTLKTTAPLSVSSALLLGEQASSGTDEIEFINRIILSSPNGNLYVMNTKEEKGYIDKTLSLPKTEAKSWYSSSAIAIGKFEGSKDRSYIISSHSDWSLRIWTVDRTTPVAIIQGSDVVERFAVRPGDRFQIVTLSIVDAKPLLKFWDLESQLFSPIAELFVGQEKNIVTRVEFNPQGDNVILGYKDGSVEVWAVPENVLPQKKKSELDNGLTHYLEHIHK